MKLDLTKIDGIIFDLDGTIADSMPLHYEAWDYAARSYGLSFSMEQHEMLAGKPTKKIVEIISNEQNIEVDIEVFNQKKEQYFLDHIETITVNEHVAEIAWQHHNKIPMAIGTGGSRYVAKKTIRFLDLQKYIPILVCADDVENYKPAPDTFLKCAELMKVQAEKCLVFEDAINGLMGAKNAGMQVIDVTKVKKFEVLMSG